MVDVITSPEEVWKTFFGKRAFLNDHLVLLAYNDEDETSVYLTASDGSPAISVEIAGKMLQEKVFDGAKTLETGYRDALVTYILDPVSEDSPYEEQEDPEKSVACLTEEDVARLDELRLSAYELMTTYSEVECDELLDEDTLDDFVHSLCLLVADFGFSTRCPTVVDGRVEQFPYDEEAGI